MGLATAREWQLRHPSHRVAVLEKEAGVGRHQTGHNSGVIHAGIYYKPGSLKASLCVQGRRLLLDYLSQHRIPHEICGKLIVAANEAEEAALEVLFSRGASNGLQGLERLSQEQLLERQPGVKGVKGIFVPETGIVDYREVCMALTREIESRNGVVLLSHEVSGIKEANGNLSVHCRSNGQDSTLEAGYLINCAGLQCDLVARKMGIEPGIRIIPFRGEYFIIPRANAPVALKHLIYPVPDPTFPFLGVHFTKDLQGNIECGPNAVLAWSREGYSRWNYNLREAISILFYPGTRAFGWKHFGIGISELRRSLSLRRFGDSLRILMPSVRDEMLEPAPAGVRAQAMKPDGALVDDFWFQKTERSTHVLNAPSPAATASLAIAKEIVSKAVGP